MKGKTTTGLVEFLRTVPPAGENGPLHARFLAKLPSLQMDEELEETFWCFAKMRNVPLGQCLDSYVSHTAHKTTRSNCTECPQGKWNRRIFALS